MIAATDTHVTNAAPGGYGGALPPASQSRPKLIVSDPISSDELRMLHEKLMAIESKIAEYVQHARYIPQRRDERTGG
jgi:hypothetical protein